MTILTMLTMITFSAACGNEKDGVVKTQEITGDSAEDLDNAPNMKKEDTEEIIKDDTEQKMAQQSAKEEEMIANAESEAKAAGGMVDLRDYQLYQLTDFGNADRLELTYEEATETYTGYDGNFVIAPTPAKDGYIITLSNGMTEVAAYGVTLGMTADEAEEYWTSQGMVETNQYGNIQFQIDGNENQYLVFYQSEDGTVEKIEYTSMHE